MLSIRSTVLKALRRVLVPAVAATPILSAVAARAETIDFHIYRYCALGTWCGHESDEAYRQYILQAVQEMNLIFKPTGISFRPKIMEIDSTSPIGNHGLPGNMDKYYKALGCVPASTQLNNHWRENVAKPDSQAISIMLTNACCKCCSRIPRTTKNPQKQYGIFCDASNSRGVIQTGMSWAHEMGHHWCLAHTFGTLADLADGQDPTTDRDAIADKACHDWDNDTDMAVFCTTDTKCLDLGLGQCDRIDALPVVWDTPADRGKFEYCSLKCQGDPNNKELHEHPLRPRPGAVRVPGCGREGKWRHPQQSHLVRLEDEREGLRPHST